MTKRIKTLNEAWSIKNNESLFLLRRIQPICRKTSNIILWKLYLPRIKAFKWSHATRCHWQNQVQQVNVFLLCARRLNHFQYYFSMPYLVYVITVCLVQPVSVTVFLSNDSLCLKKRLCICEYTSYTGGQSECRCNVFIIFLLFLLGTFCSYL